MIETTNRIFFLIILSKQLPYNRINSFKHLNYSPYIEMPYTLHGSNNYIPYKINTSVSKILIITFGSVGNLSSPMLTIFVQNKHNFHAQFCFSLMVVRLLCHALPVFFQLLWVGSQEFPWLPSTKFSSKEVGKLEDLAQNFQSITNWFQISGLKCLIRILLWQ